MIVMDPENRVSVLMDDLVSGGLDLGEIGDLNSEAQTTDQSRCAARVPVMSTCTSCACCH